jgi:hypothetical protein
MSIQIDLAGSEGNVFALIGLAKQIGKESGMNKADIEAITKKMMSGDYHDLLDALVESFPGFDFEFDNDPRNPE